MAHCDDIRRYCKRWNQGTDWTSSQESRNCLESFRLQSWQGSQDNCFPQGYEWLCCHERSLWPCECTCVFYNVYSYISVHSSSLTTSLLVLLFKLLVFQRMLMLKLNVLLWPIKCVTWCCIYHCFSFCLLFDRALRYAFEHLSRFSLQKQMPFLAIYVPPQGSSWRLDLRYTCLLN